MGAMVSVDHDFCVETVFHASSRSWASTSGNCGWIHEGNNRRGDVLVAFISMKHGVSVTDFAIVLIAEELDVDPSTITILSRLDEIGADSLDVASIIVSLGEKIGPLDKQKALEADTVGDLIRAIKVC